MNKLRSLREELAVTGSPGIVVSMLDEVAWMFNLRGSDIAYNPVCVILRRNTANRRCFSPTLSSLNAIVPSSSTHLQSLPAYVSTLSPEVLLRSTTRSVLQLLSHGATT
jgi:hypothetical protein